MKEDHKNIIEYTIGFGRANFYAILLVVPILIVLVFPFVLIWGYNALEIESTVFGGSFILIFFVGVILHELLHGITWAYFLQNGFKPIKFGVKWKYLTPYCHCTAPLKVNHYRVGIVMPLIVLGILPSLIATILGNGYLLYFGILFSVMAGGDIIALFMLKEFVSDSFVSDHPSKMGFYQEVREKETDEKNINFLKD